MHLAARISKMEQRRVFGVSRDEYEIPEENRLKVLELIQRAYCDPDGAYSSVRESYEKVRGMTPEEAREEVLAWRLPEAQCA